MNQNLGPNNPQRDSEGREQLFSDQSLDLSGGDGFGADEPKDVNIEQLDQAEDHTARPAIPTRPNHTPDRAAVGPDPVVVTAGSTARDRDADSPTVFSDEHEENTSSRSELLADPARGRGAYDIGDVEPGARNEVGDDAADEKRFGVSLGIRFVLAIALIAAVTGALSAAMNIDFVDAFAWTVLGGLLFFITDALMTRFERSHGVRNELL